MEEEERWYGKDFYAIWMNWDVRNSMDQDLCRTRM